MIRASRPCWATLVVTGGIGFDRLLLSSETDTLGGEFTVDSLIGVINVGGFGHGVAVGNDVEQLELRTGSGNDVFKVEKLQLHVDVAQDHRGGW